MHNTPDVIDYTSPLADRALLVRSNMPKKDQRGQGWLYPGRLLGDNESIELVKPASRYSAHLTSCV